jgi:ATPase subunit of ABC transporter with duplicated ATPase domains
VDRIWDIDDLKVVAYPGNYTFFAAEKELARSGRPRSISGSRRRYRSLRRT